MPALIDAYQDWYCPNCKQTERTRPLPANASRMHPCPRLHGLTVPFVMAGTKAKVYAREREDVVGNEKVQTAPDDGRPYMSVVTERDHGQDAVVYAPTATGEAYA